MKHRVIVALGIVISIVLLAFALRDVSVAELLEHIEEAEIWWLVAATVAATGTFALRAIRWRILLLPVVGGLSFNSRFATICIGFMANNVIGARVGEVARAYALTRVEPIGLSPVVASLVVERILDGVITVGLLIPAYYVLGPERLSEAGPLFEILAGFIVVVALGVMVAAALVWFPDRMLAISKRLTARLPAKLSSRLLEIIEAFIGGLAVLRHGRILAMAFLWSLVVWLWNAFSFYLAFFAFDIVEPGFVGAMMLQSVISLFVAIPSTPGFFGPFEFGARVGLGLYSIEPARVISFAATYHILTFLPVTVLGIWYMRKLGITRREIAHAGDVHADEEKSGPPDSPAAGGPV